MNDIIPAILVQDDQEFRERMSLVSGLTEWVQLDVLDGTLYPNASWCDFDFLATEPLPAKLELHLMVDDPGQLIEGAVGIESIGRIIWHVEADGDHIEMLKFVRSNGIQTGIAISPDTPIEALVPFRDWVDEILVLGVQPGFSGQALIPEMVEKARQINLMFPTIALGFDGGITTESIPDLRQAGVTRFYAASAIFKADDATLAIATLRGV
jgi:ribulose-phosphate 3-epimerase